MSLKLDPDNNFVMNSTYLKFILLGSSQSGVTKVVEVRSKRNEHHSLGRIEWFAPWRKYCFKPANGTVFDVDCLRDLQAFLLLLNDQHKEEVASRKRMGPASASTIRMLD